MIDMARSLPRSRWYRADAIAVSAVYVTVVVALLTAWGQARERIAWLSAADQRLDAQSQTLAASARTTAVELEHLQRSQSRRDAIFAQRRSGLVLANIIEAQGRALAGEALAAKLDSQSIIEGYAASYTVVSAIWTRLGSSYVLASAEPAGAQVHFRFEALTEVPLAPASRRRTP